MPKPELLDVNEMTNSQRACYDYLVYVFRGADNVPPVKAWEDGLKINVADGQLATYDGDLLSRVVILAHDRCIRVEITSAGANRVGLCLRQRMGRSGRMSEIHPPIDTAVFNTRRTLI